MQTPDWNDLRYLLAVMQTGRMASASRGLGVDPTTVARRIARLEESVGERLVRRQPDGSLELTRQGMLLADAAESFRGDLDAALGSEEGSAASVAGVVRLTAVPFLANRLLAPSVGGLLRRHPHLRVDLLAEARDLSLTRREADMALRMARPDAGGYRLKTRKIASLVHRVYAARDVPPEARDPAWIGYDDAMAHLPHARWIRARAREQGQSGIRLQVKDMETALESVAAGYGRSVFPAIVADRDPRLVALESPANVPVRDVWLLVHADLADLPRIAAVADWLDGVLS